MKKQFIVTAAALIWLFLMTGCAGRVKVPENSRIEYRQETSVSREDSGAAHAEKEGPVRLRFWCDENEIPMFEQRISQFLLEHQNEADIEAVCEPVGASDCKDTFLADTDNGADVFCMPDDQLLSMAAAGVLEEIPDSDKISGRNLEGAVQAASVDGRMYAYPLTADNGYFLYYDKRYFREEDVKTLDRILDVCAAHGKKFVMSFTSGWYLYSFFGNTGLAMGAGEDGLTNYCEWNAIKGEVTGTDIAKALLKISSHPGFQDADDDMREEIVKSGTAIAAVSGIWDAALMENAFGGEYGACKLPSYTCAGKQIQMSSFKGYRLLGVNSYSQHREWAERLADYLSDEESQKFFFEQAQHGPANRSAAASDAVKAVPAITAVLEQSEYGVLQEVGQKYWMPVMEFGTVMAAGNPDNIPLQDLMDELAAGITES